MTDQCCDTCGHYNNPDSDYECQWWEECCPENTCSKWVEGFHNHNLRFRILSLEKELDFLRSGYK